MGESRISIDSKCSDINELIANKNFVNLDAEGKQKCLTASIEEQAQAGGFIGKIIGVNSVNAAINCAFTLCIILIIFAIGCIVLDNLCCLNVRLDIIKTILPVITLLVGYIFGRG